MMFLLEDFIDAANFLKMETTENLTRIEELDRQVQNSKEDIDDKIQYVFTNALSRPEQYSNFNLEMDHKRILNDFEEILGVSEEKVDIANTMVGSLSKYIKRLDEDIFKFKLELDAANNGISEKIERKVEGIEDVQNNDFINLSNSYSRENSNDGFMINDGFQYDELIEHNCGEVFTYSSLQNEKLHNDILISESGNNSKSSLVLKLNRVTPNAYQVSDEPKFLERKQSSSKAESTKVSHGVPSTRNKRRRMKSTSNYKKRLSHEISQNIHAEETIHQHVYVPDETKYCYCKEGDYGRMVACEGESCPIEWFHYQCVGIDEAPEGDWYCKECLQKMNEKNNN